MIDKFLKIAGVNNMDDFYKLHPSEEHFFKTYPNAKKELKKKQLKKAAKGGPTDIPAKLVPYFEEQMKRQGKVLLTDKGTNMTYYGTKKPDGSWDVNSFEVLTGANVNQNNVITRPNEELRDNFNLKGTPLGIFPLGYDANLYGMPGYRLLGSAVGDHSKVGDAAYHVTYAGPHDKGRAALYNNNNAQDNYRSNACINCQKPSMEHLMEFVGKTPNIQTYIVNSGLSEAENRKWFSKNTPKYIYTANSEKPTLVSGDIGDTLSSIGSSIGDAVASAGNAFMDAFGFGDTAPTKPVAAPVRTAAPVAKKQTVTPIKSPTATAPKQQVTPKKDTGYSSVQPSKSSNHTLARGGTEQVAQFQEFLNKQTGSNLTVDGAWGPKTQAAYDMYMAKKRAAPALASNEYEYGGETYSENNNSMKNKTVRRYQKGGKTAGSAYFTNPFTGQPGQPFGYKGYTGEQEFKAQNKKRDEMLKVKEFQTMLNKEMGTNLAVDGMWGPKTQAAYERYMGKKNLTAMEEMPMNVESRIGMPAAPEAMRYIPTAEPVMTPVYGSSGVQEGWSGMEYAMGGYYQQGGGVNPMQIVQAYAQAVGVDPRQIMAQLKQMAPEEQQVALQEMMQQLQGGQQGQYAMGGRNTIRRPRRESSEEMMQQVMQDASDNFKREANPEKVLNYIQSKGVSEEAAMQMLQQIVDRAENDDEYARGGGIRIKPSRRGTFTAQATRMGMGVQEAAKHILANKDRYSSKMVRKANFARNASKWKHAHGGYAGMYQEGGEAMPQEMMEGAPQQMQEQQGGQDQMMQQLMQMVAQALQQGTPPEQIVQMLVQQGVPEEVAIQAVQMVMQQMGSAPQGGPGQQYQPQGAQYQGPQQMAAMGGYYANGGINNPGFRALPPSVQQKIMDNMAYGGYYEDGGFFNQSYMPFDY